MSATPREFVPDDLDAILDALAAQDNEWADLAALHAPYGLWDDRRKIILSECALELRKGRPPAGATAWTDKLLDTAAHAHETYKAAQDQAETNAKRWRRLERRRIRLELKARSLTYNPVR